MISTWVLLSVADARASQSGAASQYLLLIAGVAIVALTIAGIYFWTTLRKPRDGDDEAASQSLFTELCEAHELSRAERSLLGNLVRAYEMQQPAMLFVEPWTLDQASAASDPDALRYDALRQKLFGSVR